MRLSALIFISMLVSIATPAMADKDASSWFTSHYAKNWESRESLRAEKLAGFFSASGQFRLADGSAMLWESSDSFQPFVAMQIEAGWLSSKVEAIEAQVLTPNSTVLTVRWLGSYGEANSVACEWYLVDRNGEAGWKISAAAQLACSND
jgi:hypothetical protein